MKKQAMLELFLIFVIFLTIFPTNFLNYSVTPESNEIMENPKISSESGGGYIMDTSASYSWIELAGTGGTNMTQISNSDDNYQKLNISELAGWNFTFYETEYDCIYVSSNGWMSFPNRGYTDDWIDEIPSISEENIDGVAVFGDDLNMKLPPDGSGDIYFQFFGTTLGNRYLVIEYYQVSYYGGDYLGTFEVIFYESGDIKFQYLILQNIDGSYDIGLDHGDLTNYNRFDDWVSGQDIVGKAISFTYNVMVSVQYELGMDVNDQLSWIVTKLNNLKMELFYSPNWEAKFGLPPNIQRGYKTMINITSIEQNSTHWEINYTLWDWTYRLNDFSSTFSGKDSLLYRREPLNYTAKHNLTNIFPYFVPKPTPLYLRNANLSYLYDGLYYSSYRGITYLEIDDSKIINGDYISIWGEAEYNNDGLLQEMYIESYNGSSDEYEIIFEMQNATPTIFSEFNLSFNIGDNYIWYVRTVNDYYMDLSFGTDWENKFGYFPSMSVGEKTMIEISSISENSTHWDIKYDMWDWIPADNAFKDAYDIDPNLIYRKDSYNYTQMHNLTYIAPFLSPISVNEYLANAYLDEEFYYDVDYYSSSGITSLEFDLDPPGADVDGDAEYDSNGILISLEIEYENDDEFTIFEITRSKPPSLNGSGDGDDDDSEENITGLILVIVFASLGAGVAVVIFLIKKGIIKTSKLPFKIKSI